MSPEVYKYFADPFERAGKTAAQTYLVLVLAAGVIDIHNTDLLRNSLLPALFAGVIALITSYVAILTGVKVTGVWDLVRRFVLTFAQAFLGVMVASMAVDFISAPWEAAVGAGITAALTSLLTNLGQLRSPETLGASAVRAPGTAVGANQ